MGRTFIPDNMALWWLAGVSVSIDWKNMLHDVNWLQVAEDVYLLSDRVAVYGQIQSNIELLYSSLCYLRA